MSSLVYCKEYLYRLQIYYGSFVCGSSKATGPCHRRQENLTSLLMEVLRLRLHALNLPITGSKAELICRLTSAVEQLRADRLSQRLERLDIDLSQFGLSAPQSVPPIQEMGAFSEAQIAAIQDTVRLSVKQSLNSHSNLPVVPSGQKFGGQNSVC